MLVPRKVYKTPLGKWISYDFRSPGVQKSTETSWKKLRSLDDENKLKVAKLQSGYMNIFYVICILQFNLYIMYIIYSIYMCISSGSIYIVEYHYPYTHTLGPAQTL